MVTEGSYTWSQPRVMYRVAESLCCTLETNVALCVSRTSIKKLKKLFEEMEKKSKKEEEEEEKLLIIQKSLSYHDNTQQVSE